MWYKESLDLTNIISRPSDSSGMYGEYWSNFTPEEKQKLKDKVGPLPESTGIKKFHDNVKFNDLASENLAFLFIAPYIKEHTNINVPSPHQKVSLSNMFTSKYAVTQHMPGVHINKPPSQYLGLPYARYLNDEMREILRSELSQKLMDVGVYIDDLHSLNVLVAPEKVEEFWQNYAKFCQEEKNIDIDTPMDFISIYPQYCNFSDFATVIDFGRAKCTHYVAKETGLMDFYTRVQNEQIKNPKNKYLRFILAGIDQIIGF